LPDPLFFFSPHATVWGVDYHSCLLREWGCKKKNGGDIPRISSLFSFPFPLPLFASSTASTRGELVGHFFLRRTVVFSFLSFFFFVSKEKVDTSLVAKVPPPLVVRQPKTGENVPPGHNFFIFSFRKRGAAHKLAEVCLKQGNQPAGARTQ